MLRLQTGEAYKRSNNGNCQAYTGGLHAVSLVLYAIQTFHKPPRNRLRSLQHAQIVKQAGQLCSRYPYWKSVVSMPVKIGIRPTIKKKNNSRTGVPFFIFLCEISGSQSIHGSSLRRERVVQDSVPFRVVNSANHAPPITKTDKPVQGILFATTEILTPATLSNGSTQAATIPTNA